MNKEFSLIDAEKVFKDYGCSHFYLSRETPDLYTHYKNLDISADQERRWAEESCDEWIKRLADDTTSRNELWGMHSRATHLAEYIKSLTTFNNLYEASRQILEKVPESDCIMCAENIMGRKDVAHKEGIVFQCILLGEPKLATSFLKLVGKFLNRHNQHDTPRSQQAATRAKIIGAMIKI